MSELPILKAKELIRVIEKLGFFKHHQVGSHAQFKHSDGRRVTIPIHGGKDIGKKTLKGIIDDLKIGSDEFVKILRD
ncbi:MAG: hypothetical protein A3A28_03945 [Candidatus Sungbacteria bacterium RIFCSPLOWO2_01_FULL_47_32]|uniref:Addiction module toxin, HicA family n=1 Tax=Candidatus Sungbacteria bacterium RIFCSPHIGHO2_01_FULL_47_32 TaxID=1802264 RepID=A0A1G2K1X0_9BACT|nr:MAG: YcfA family protein [Parcubacteria group bacterium GW2011_GWA2_47_10]OGZ93406.1 MAG: hypothetical protein A2633_01635 [Candidatus Sungbacteria bacterium RIFCSPHIGHO2_01_FULL_47_32]OGZ99843.1 MAG: hypothetical protein A3D57_01280 [Candidatus Sungbacteria bacterium RIFCSPHIGHO2_02_FULL_46_12]OHA05060.1 MAG: hypothetical protein A3A28_03945 [Candidatus Sungbacteria bacterium RIFCSPLOWO2_01_FULL_47_32]